MPEKQFAASAARNAAPILEVLGRELRDCTDVLEIGSGTGQHAVAFAGKMPYLQWQTSDLEVNHNGIKARIEEVQFDNLHAPMLLDVRQARLDRSAFDAAYSANTAHIMDIDAVASMFRLVGIALRVGGKFCLYGPVRIAGSFGTESNAVFDENLRRRDPTMGIRDLEILDRFATGASLKRMRLYAMPSNNHLAVWVREEGT